MNFIGKIRQNEKAVFLGKVIFFYLLLMILWMHFMLAKDSASKIFLLYISWDNLNCNKMS